LEINFLRVYCQDKKCSVIFVVMEITYFGHSCFRIKGKAASVVTDPYGEKLGKLPRDLEASLITVSNVVGESGKVGGNPFVMDSPGEIEARGVSVVGVATDAGTVFVIELEGLRIAHLGDLVHKLSTEQLAEIGPIDVVMVALGSSAAELVHQVDPWVAIPMGFEQGSVELAAFLKEMGKTEVIPMAKYLISVDKLPEDLQVVVLERK
jgi:L-ascorbate metabolism protein UlaG (beta-lactamase superfamily)